MANLDFNSHHKHIEYNDDTVKEIDIYEIEKYLEWAGLKLLSLPLKSDVPCVKTSSWPEYKLEFINLHFTKLSLKPPAPNGFEIDTLDLILNLINLISDVQIRRIVRSRTLLHPITQIHLYSWDKISTLILISSKTCKSRYISGLNTIKHKVDVKDFIKIQTRMEQIL